MDWQDFIISLSEAATPQMKTVANYQTYINERDYQKRQKQEERNARMMESVFENIYLPRMRDEDKVKFQQKYQTYFDKLEEEKARREAKADIQKEAIIGRMKEIRERRSGLKKEEHFRTTPEYQMKVEEFDIDLAKKKAELEQTEEETRQLRDFTKRQKAEMGADEKRRNKAEKMPPRYLKEMDSIFDERTNAVSQVGWSFKKGTLEYNQAVDEVYKYFNSKMDALDEKYTKGREAGGLKDPTIEADKRILKEAISKGIINNQLIYNVKKLWSKMDQEDADQLEMELQKLNPKAYDELSKAISGSQK